MNFKDHKKKYKHSQKHHLMKILCKNSNIFLLTAEKELCSFGHTLFLSLKYDPGWKGGPEGHLLKKHYSLTTTSLRKKHFAERSPLLCKDNK